MKVRRFYHPGAAVVRPGDSLRYAARCMREHAVSCVPVMVAGTLFGILTERDLVEAAANGVRPSMARVEDYMNTDLVSATLDEDCAVAAMKMLAIGCRHLPVTDGGNLVGMISARDVYLASVQSGSEGVLVS